MAILAILHVMKSITYKHQIHRFRVFRQSLRIYKFRINLWISYFFDDITTSLGPEKTLIRVSGVGGFHPSALQEPHVTVSRHTAPTVQPMADSQIPKTQTA